MAATIKPEYIQFLFGVKFGIAIIGFPVKLFHEPSLRDEIL